jgi:hypothetical protein
MKNTPQWLCGLAAAVTLALAACGGGSGSDAGSTGPTSNSAGSTGPVSSALGASPGAESSGTISAFGSVFVNGHEFDTRSAHVFDDDTGSWTTGTASLEVGMMVDVKAGADSSSASPSADEVHVHPLARGVVDASNTTASTLTVLGQTVQLTAATNFSDHRACLTATASPCTAITGQAALSATTGSGSGAVAGTYVTVHGYLYSTSATSGAADIVATLVSVGDAPTAASGVNYQAAGLVTAVGTSSVTIGGLAIDLTGAHCFAATGASAACASAFSVGEIVSAYASAAPALPVTTLAASVARLRSRLPVQTAGASVELEGKVSSVTTAAPASFVIDGVTVDASTLTTTLPAVGDQVRVLGTVASGGTSVTATSVSVLHAAASATFGLEGNVDGVVAGSTANTYTLSLLGQRITVDASGRLADRSGRDGYSGGSSSNPFNISTFQTYLAASSSQHVQVQAQTDGSGNLSALAVTIVPASTVAAISGTVDASPVPFNSTATGTPTTFAIHGLAVSADPSSIAKQYNGRRSTTTAISAGDLVLAVGTYASGTLTVAATTGASRGPVTNEVIDSGPPSSQDHGCF